MTSAALLNLLRDLEAAAHAAWADSLTEHEPIQQNYYHGRREAFLDAAMMVTKAIRAADNHEGD